MPTRTKSSPVKDDTVTPVEPVASENQENVDPEIQAILDDENARLNKVFEDAQNEIRLAYLQDRVISLAKDNNALRAKLESLQAGRAEE